MKRVSIIIIIICIIFNTSYIKVNAQEITPTPTKKADILDALETGYGVLTDADLWKGVLGVYTNTLGLTFGKMTANEYRDWVNGFSDYLNNYQLALDDHLQFDSKTGNIAVSTDLQKYMTMYVNQKLSESGYFKIVSNPYIAGKVLIAINSFAQTTGNNAAIDLFNTLNKNPNGVYVCNISKISEDTIYFTYSNLMNNTDVLNCAYYAGNSIVSGATFDNISDVLFGYKNSSFFVRTWPYKVVTPSSGGTISNSIITIDKTGFYSTYNGYFNQMNFYNQSSDDYMIKGHFILGQGYTYGMMGADNFKYNTIDLTKPYAPLRYKNFKPNTVQYYNAKEICFGDHYTYNKNIYNTINNYYIENPDATENDINDVIDTVDQDNPYPVITPTPVPTPDYDNNKTNILSTILGLLGNLLGFIINIITDITSILLDGVGGLLSSLIGLLNIDIYKDTVDNTSFFSFISSIFTIIPNGIKAPFIISFIAIAVSLVIKKLIE